MQPISPRAWRVLLSEDSGASEIRPAAGEQGEKPATGDGGHVAAELREATSRMVRATEKMLPSRPLSALLIRATYPTGRGRARLLSRRVNLQSSTPRSSVRTWEMDTLSRRPAPPP